MRIRVWTLSRVGVYIPCMTRFLNDARLGATLHNVESLSRQAGRAVLDFYRQQNFRVLTKDDQSPVTDADLESSRLLENALPALLPGSVVVSEENEQPATDLCWLVDPLDGTQEFLDRSGGFSIKIALTHNAVPILGVVHCPVQGITYASTRNSPALRRDHRGQVQVLHTAPPPSDRPLKAVFNAKSNPMDTYRAERAMLAQHGVMLSQRPTARPGLPRNLRVADGNADMNIGRTGYGWDLAADMLILRNAGGDMFCRKTGADLSFDAPRTLNGPYFATNDPHLRRRLFP